MSAVDVALRAIEAGVLSVDAQGRIWKQKRKTSAGRLVNIAPKRTECRLKNGYLGVTCWEGGRQFLVLAHRLVWTVRNGPIPPSSDINHLDGDKANNSPSNLETATRGANLRHAAQTGLRTYARLAPEVMDRARELRATGMSYSAVAKEVGISQTSAFRAANR